MPFPKIDKELLKKAFRILCLTRATDRLYEEHYTLTDKYAFSTARGHEALQIATAFHLKPFDFVAPYYRDEALLLGLGVPLEDMMLQLMGKPTAFSSGKNPYLLNPAHPDGLPALLFSGNGAGMQVIPATGVAQGLAYLASLSSIPKSNQSPLVVCSLGDGVMTHGETAESLQMALLKKLPVVYLVQDNDWMASNPAQLIRAADAYELAGGFRGMKRSRVNGADFVQAYESIGAAVEYVRTENLPVLLQVKTPLLGNHSSELKKETYRPASDLELHRRDEPFVRLKKYLIIEGVSETETAWEEREAERIAKETWEAALNKPDASQTGTDNLMRYDFLPSPVQTETGSREPARASTITFSQAGLKATGLMLVRSPEALFFGQETGTVARHAGLVQQFGNERVFSTPFVPAYLAGAAAGLAWAGAKPIIEFQSAESLLSGIGQLYNMASKSCYLSDGQFPVQALWRVQTGSLPESVPYQSASIESLLLGIKGLKIVYPSSAADLKGLLASAFADPNPTIVLEHRGLQEADFAESPEPDDNYQVPLGKSRVVQQASEEQTDAGYSCVVITWGMGVHLAKKASDQFPGSVEILDLRTLHPLDFEGMVSAVKRHNKALVLTEEPLENSFAEALAGRMTLACFKILDAPVHTCGAASVPALPMNETQKQMLLPTTEKVAEAIGKLLGY